jgi:outer membrane protein OmpA-like peptidoglycan-associated protein
MDTVLTNKTDTLQQTKEDKDSAVSKRDQQLQQNAIDTLAKKVDDLEQQIKEYKDYISKHRVDSFSNLKDVKEGDIVKLDKVYFETNSSYVKTESFAQLDKLAQVIKASPDMQVRILGHTDYIASDTYNMWLSERRAKHVADYLISRGVPSANVSSAGYGKRSPIADNATEAGRALNRRVEIQILKK